MKILHISDLHLSSPIGNRVSDILERFYGIVNENANRSAFDNVIISGDIRNPRGAYAPEAYEIIKKIAISAGIVDFSKVHIVPGNHDLTRDENKKVDVYKARQEYDFENGIFSDANNLLPVLNSRFDDFFWPLSDLLFASSNPWNQRNKMPHYSINTEEGCFIFLNSSLCCLTNSEDGNLIIGLAYLTPILKSAQRSKVKCVYFVAHHPIQRLDNSEDTALQELLGKFNDIEFRWLCGDAHEHRSCTRDHIKTYQVGSLTKYEDVIPDFAIYDIENGNLTHKIFRFLPHLNSTSSPSGGWKRVYVY
jgi:predicted phosphodiesterase